MHPQIRQPNPGPCPICSMDLIPQQSDPGGSLREVKTTNEAAALLDLRVSPSSGNPPKNPSIYPAKSVTTRAS